jgi:hypothetical protein
MLTVLVLTRKWIAWYRVLRYGKEVGFLDAVRYGLWLARSCSGDYDDGSNTF